ncbi:MAG: hypothetical protein K0R54_252 [Clostridiaceae bacterium]|jgi:hypothetical protein|nr:hypothetical protein [Clostridiaceae bacterium]
MMDIEMMDIYEIRAEIDCLEDDLLQAYGNDDEEQIRIIKNRIENLKEQEEILMKLH